MEVNEYVIELIEKSRKAQKEFEKYSQGKVDSCVRAVGKVIYDNAEELAKMAVEESGMGVYEDKIAKNKNKPKATWYKLKNVKSRGIIEYDDINKIVKVAKPIGVVGCITPSTNPTMTPVHNAMVALKGGNSLIVCPHPGTKMTTTKSVEYMRKALKEIGAPEDLIQVISEPTLTISGTVMQYCDTTIATGGPSMVKAAYSSGRPAFGVGPGNVQSLVDTDADLAQAAPKIIKSRSNDNGVLCTCEQCVHVQEDIFEKLVNELVKAGAYYVCKNDEIEKLRNATFPGGKLSKQVVGKTALKIAEIAEINVPKDTKVLLVGIDKCGESEVFAREKLFPVLSICKYKDWDEAINNAMLNLNNEGAGHSIVIHSHTKDHIETAAVKLPISRIGVNMVGSSGLGGGLDNGLNPTASLSCGSWGGNSISENLWWNHLVNISRIAYVKENFKLPSDEEIWG